MAGTKIQSQEVTRTKTLEHLVLTNVRTPLQDKALGKDSFKKRKRKKKEKGRKEGREEKVSGDNHLRIRYHRLIVAK